MFLQNIFRITKTLWGQIISLFILGIQMDLVMKKSLLPLVQLRQSFMALAS